MKTSFVEKRKEDKCHQSFRRILDLLDVADDTLEGLCEKCSELPDIKRLTTRTLDQIYTIEKEEQPGVPVNRPEFLCIFYEEKDVYFLKGDLYRSGAEGFVAVETDMSLQRSSCPTFNLAQIDIFTINVPSVPEERDAFQKRFHPAILERIGGPIRNCVGYHVHGERDGIIIGFNYPEEVTRYDGEIMKSLAVTVGSLSTLARQITEIKEGFIYLIESLSRASEVNDADTGNHIVRVNTFAKHLAMALGQSEAFCNEIGLVAQMHDVGKIHTPSEILRKPGELTTAERKIMEQHTLQGEIILGNAPKLLMARNIASAHHENYDGSGYPRGLTGEEIPIEAQIVKICDVYDALRSVRPYKEAFPHEEALKVIFSKSGHVQSSHFNPALLDLFHQETGAFEEIYENLK
jgi:HD-GYP domain-containing protein (c-di-GMP phosphodiesterase class II)